MFGKRSSLADALATRTAAAVAPARIAETTGQREISQPEPVAQRPAPPPPPPVTAVKTRSESFYTNKSTVFGAMLEAIDLAALAKVAPATAREEIREIVNEIVSIKNIVMSLSDQEELLDDICNDILGFGPLEPLLARDDIADIMVNGANKTFIEVGGKIQLTGIRFRDNTQLMNICQRMVSMVGRRVD